MTIQLSQSRQHAQEMDARSKDPMFTVYSKPSCPFCDQAKSLLRSKDLKYTEIILDVGQHKEIGTQYISRNEMIALIPSARTMPQIVLENDSSAVCIGGFLELKKYLHA